jgi:hypothetical protein
MAGVNLDYGAQQRQLESLFWKYLGNKCFGANKVLPKICSKAGVPTSNAEGDAPEAIGDICIDITNEDIYVSTAFTNATSHTWTKITP